MVEKESSGESTYEKEGYSWALEQARFFEEEVVWIQGIQQLNRNYAKDLSSELEGIQQKISELEEVISTTQLETQRKTAEIAKLSLERMEGMLLESKKYMEATIQNYDLQIADYQSKALEFRAMDIDMVKELEDHGGQHEV